MGPIGPLRIHLNLTTVELTPASFSLNESSSSYKTKLIRASCAFPADQLSNLKLLPNNFPICNVCCVILAASRSSINCKIHFTVFAFALLQFS